MHSFGYWHRHDHRHVYSIAATSELDELLRYAAFVDVVRRNDTVGSDTEVDATIDGLESSETLCSTCSRSDAEGSWTFSFVSGVK